MTGRPARIVVDLEALRTNYRLLKKHHGASVMAVLKADAYGHGAVRCARALSTADGSADAFAVAFVAEAIELRDAGVKAPILVLEGAFDSAELLAANQAGLWTVVHQSSQIRMMEALPRGSSHGVWLKIDSGMHRAGFSPEEVRSAWRQLKQSDRVGDITLMSHFARADEPDQTATQVQIARFDRATQGLEGQRSLANSAGIVAWPASWRDWGRAGIALYGVDPIPTKNSELRPVMQLRSGVFALRNLPKGSPIGYGAAWIAPRPTRVGLVAMGYADGYPRAIRVGTNVCVDGQRAPIVGRVSMDMLTVDLTDIPLAGIGSEVEFWGRQVSVSEVAESAGTIPYELLCGVKRARVSELEDR